MKLIAVALLFFIAVDSGRFEEIVSSRNDECEGCPATFDTWDGRQSASVDLCDFQCYNFEDYGFAVEFIKFSDDRCLEYENIECFWYENKDCEGIRGKPSKSDEYYLWKSVKCLFYWK